MLPETMEWPSLLERIAPGVWLRRCMTCGLLDRSWRFSSPEEAADFGIWQAARRCRICGEIGFDLVPTEDGPCGL